MTDPTPCASCDRARNLPPGIVLCFDCTTTLQEILHDVPNLALEGTTTLERLDRVTAPGQSGGGGVKAQSTAPSNQAASEALAYMTENLRTWANYLDETYGPTGAVSAWRRILHHVDHIRSGPAKMARQILNDLTEDRKAVLRVIDLPPERILLGTCDAAHEDQPCPGKVKGIRGHHEARCDTCGETYSQAERVRLAVANSWEHPRPLRTIVRALNAAGFPLRHGTAKQWVKRGKLAPTGSSPDGVNLYTMDQVHAVLQEQKQKAEGKQRAA